MTTSAATMRAAPISRGLVGPVTIAFCDSGTASASAVPAGMFGATRVALTLVRATRVALISVSS